jgi:hypothetical protein
VSSAILYAAIVAIWIGVIVPRWLRHDYAHVGHLRLRQFSRRRDTVPDAGEASARAGFSDDSRTRYTSFGGPGTAPTAQGAPAEAVADPFGSEFDAAAPVRPYGWSAEEYLRQERIGQRDSQGKAERRHAERPPRPPRPHDGVQAVPGPGERPGTADSGRRRRVVRGRRRLLSMLVVVTAIAIGCASFSLAAWWVVVPPTVLLLGYLMLLREAAHADAEARERAAVLPRRGHEAETQRSREAEAHRAEQAQREQARREQARREQARREQARREQARREQARRAATAGTPPGEPAPVWAAHETLSHAKIIDISDRVGDQLYDQYADAKLRAVGD